MNHYKTMLVKCIICFVFSTYAIAQTVIQIDLPTPQDSLLEVTPYSSIDLAVGVPIILNVNDFIISGGSFPYTHFWAQDGTQINNGESLQITPEDETKYSLLVTDEKHCQTELILNPDKTGIKNRVNTPFKIYPTIASNVFTIDLGEIQSITKVEIYDVNSIKRLDKTIYSTTQIPFELPSGIYYVRIILENEQYINKIIIQE